MTLKLYYQKAMLYDEYLDLLGENLKLHELHYRKFVLPERLKSEISSYKPVQIFVITEPCCGDSLALLPIVKKIAEENTNWNLKFILRDENPELMSQFMTGKSRSIPIFLFVKNYEKLLFHWGPRPKAAQNIFEDHRDLIMQGKILKQDVIKKIRMFYAKDKGQSSLPELMELFRKYIS
jgi:hypothetical protein